MGRGYLVAVALLAGSGAVAQEVRPRGFDASKIGIEQRYGQAVPADATFLDEKGNRVALGNVLGKRPVVLMPMFFTCAGVCRLETEDLFKMLEKNKRVEVGRDFDVVLLSVNPKETPEIARAKETRLLKVYGLMADDPGVHSWVGEEAQVRRVTESVGFKYHIDPLDGQISHAAGIIFLDPQGVVRGYMYGAQFPTDVFIANVRAAAQGKQGARPEIILLGCIMIDPVTGKRTLLIKNLAAMMGIATALILGGSIAYMSVKYRTVPARGRGQGGTATGA